MNIEKGLQIRKSLSQHQIDITDYYSVEGKKSSNEKRKPNFLERMQEREKQPIGLVPVHFSALPPLEVRQMQISTNVREVMRQKREKSAPQARNRYPVGEVYPLRQVGSVGRKT